MRPNDRVLPLSLMIGGATLILLDVARRIFRARQLFSPSPEPVKTWDPADYGIPREAVEEKWFETPDGELLYGWYCRAPHPVASAVYCHGNTGNITTSAMIIPHLLESGINVLFFDYRGFGKSTGSPNLAGIVTDGLAAAEFHETIRPKELPSILYGYSLGGAVAGQVIRHYPFDGLILQSTFTNLPDITRTAFPKLPLHLLAGNFFDTIGAIRKLRVPLLLVHGDADETVPCWMSHALYDACPSVKRIEIVKDGLHKDLYLRDAASLNRAAHEFAASLPHHAGDASVRQNARGRAIDSLRRAIRRLMRRRFAPQTV